MLDYIKDSFFIKVLINYLKITIKASTLINTGANIFTYIYKNLAIKLGRKFKILIKPLAGHAAVTRYNKNKLKPITYIIFLDLLINR